MRVWFLVSSRLIKVLLHRKECKKGTFVESFFQHVTCSYNCSHLHGAGQEIIRKCTKKWHYFQREVSDLSCLEMSFANLCHFKWSHWELMLVTYEHFFKGGGSTFWVALSFAWSRLTKSDDNFFNARQLTDSRSWNVAPSLVKYLILSALTNIQLLGFLFFFKADDLRGTRVFVYTSPLAAMVFVSLWRPLNSCGMIER